MNFLKRLWLFKSLLKVYAFFSRYEIFDFLTHGLTTAAAFLTVKLNANKQLSQENDLGKVWQELMPEDGKILFIHSKTDNNTSYTEIHLHCPLRATGDLAACHKLMNYDRALLKKFGANLIVLESQANPNTPYCRLAIRPEEFDTKDLMPIHEKHYDTNTQ